MANTKVTTYTPNGEPSGWQTWESVISAIRNGKQIGKVCPKIWENNGVEYFLYSNENDLYGVLTPEQIITEPIFAKHFKCIDEKNGIFAATMAKGGNKIERSNNWGLIDIKNGKMLLVDYAAPFKLSQELFAYRKDVDHEWPNNMYWGVITLPDAIEVLPLQLFPDSDENGNKITTPIKQRLLALIS